MEKINVAEILRRCPQGMELDCILFQNLEFDRIIDSTIRCRIKNSNGGYYFYYFTEYGCWLNAINAKCVIFPKGKTTWNGFVPSCEFKDGDIVYFMNKYGNEYISIVKNIEGNYLNTYIYSGAGTNAWVIQFSEISFHIDNIRGQRFATEEEKQKLFNKIKEHGYRWNDETKTLEKLIEPKFKVGDKIIDILKKYEGASGTMGVISEITDNKYIFTDSSYIPISSQNNWELVSDEIKPKFKVGDRVVRKNGIGVPVLITKIVKEYYYSNNEDIVKFFSIKDQDEWELVPNKFDISTLVPFESRVLVRDFEDQIWRPAIFGGYIDKRGQYKYTVVGGLSYECLIPYEGNEHLRCKDDDCEEFYKTWEL